jgi:hypothetical protein
MVTKFSIVILVMGSFIVCVAAQDLPSARDRSLAGRRQRHEEAVLKYLGDVAWSSRKAIRLYYQAECSPMKGSTVDYSVPFPFFKVRPPSRDKTGLTAVREMFKNARDVTIAEEPTGIIRIWIGKVPTEILQTRIFLLTLKREEQYDPNLAIGAIESTKEMNGAMTSLGVTSAPDGGGLMTQPANDLPYLPASMKNVTLDQALDIVAKTWGGPVVYGACTIPTNKKGAKLFALWYGGSVVGKAF